METLTIRETAFGSGLPKICVPIMGDTVEELLAEATLAAEQQVDVVEWRADFFTDLLNEGAVKKAAALLRERLQIPVIFTVRTKREGGTLEISDADYAAVIRSASTWGTIDMVDVELTQPDLETLLAAVKHTATRIILSSHDFEKTPSADELTARLLRMVQLGADLPKIAVMPKNSTDVLVLLHVAEHFKQQYGRPFIAISMGHKGMISRVSGELFGSVLTFGTLEKASAPGQVEVGQLRSLLELFHDTSLL
ncbi:3-dehydroquinate dehydratase [Listeria grayi]|uniref:3-dehydroquinate dehydratase n=1 Tax=Listeria grayi FSL F6-1183 TaxID=1265827 RepID=A0A829R4C1_LISGR|nr:type I 3-dehydroquinate dehydratase [Listeria grayi]EUJ26265.1 3-dehydroquinate dehydratase [Listeria grayi FSL F6-1183]VEI32104.1 3-dehydroquinate dehydratase [Listeria grayi]